MRSHTSHRTQSFSKALAAVSAMALGLPVLGFGRAEARDPYACSGGSYSVYFQQWEYTLNDFARKVIQKAQESLAGCRIDSVRIVGMAGAIGDEDANMEVSLKRAKTVAEALEAGGWPASRFEIVAEGEKGATVNGVDVPMRRTVNFTVKASPP